MNLQEQADGIFAYLDFKPTAAQRDYVVSRLALVRLEGAGDGNR
jgi:hypothetical protein